MIGAIPFVGPMIARAVGGISLKTVLVGTAVLAIGVAGFVAYRVYANLVADVEVLAANSAKLELALQVEKQRAAALIGRIEQIAADTQANNARLAQVASDARAARTEAKKVATLFAQHDLRRILNAKPGLAQDRINAAADRSRRLLEQASRVDDHGGPAD